MELTSLPPSLFFLSVDCFAEVSCYPNASLLCLRKTARHFQYSIVHVLEREILMPLMQYTHKCILGVAVVNNILILTRKKTLFW